MTEMEWNLIERIVCLESEAFLANFTYVEPSHSHRLTGVLIHERKEVTE